MAIAQSKPTRSTLSLDARNECRHLSDADLAQHIVWLQRSLGMASEDEVPDWLIQWDAMRLEAATSEWRWRERAERKGGPAVQRLRAQERLEDLKRRVDLVELIGRGVQLRRAGSEWKGNCPFHDDRDPSFYVNPEKGVFHCHGCQVGGDVVRWVEMAVPECRGEFKLALRYIEDLAG